MASKVQALRDKTYNNMVDNLSKYGKCFVVRPTGFGKTTMMIRLMKNYKKVLFLYPTNIVADTLRKKYEKDVSNVTFMSYLGLLGVSLEDLAEYDLIVCDEAHRLGADRTRDALKSAMEKYKDTCHFVGLTATPNRMDKFDVLLELFDGVDVFKYTLHDGIEDGIFKKLYIDYMSYGYKYDAEIKIKESEKALGVKLDDGLKDYIASRTEREAQKIFGRAESIKRTCTEYLENTSYMKFICFFPNKFVLAKISKEVSYDFKKAFPDHEINTLTITSDSEYCNNVNKLDDLVPRENSIDLIFCIDMLNMGYHVSDLSGVVMYRSTDSSIIYLQQIGRCISTVDEDTSEKVVFDYVDNINRQACFVCPSTDKHEKRNLTQREMEDSNIITESDILAIGRMADYKLLYNKIEGEIVDELSKRAYWKWRQYGGGKTRPDVPIEPFCMLYGVKLQDVYGTLGIEDIYDNVDIKTKVPDEILNLTGTY